MKKIGWIVLIFITLIVAAYLYSVFFKPNYGGTNILGVLLLGLTLGGIIAFLVFKLYVTNRKEQKLQKVHTR